MSTFGERLKLARADCGMTQQELAERSGVNRVTIANLERGDVDSPRALTARRLAAALGIDTGWLMTGNDAEWGKEAA